MTNKYRITISWTIEPGRQHEGLNIVPYIFPLDINGDVLDITFIDVNTFKISDLGNNSSLGSDIVIDVDCSLLPSAVDELQIATSLVDRWGNNVALYNLKRADIKVEPITRDIRAKTCFEFNAASKCSDGAVAVICAFSKGRRFWAPASMSAEFTDIEECYDTYGSGFELSEIFQ